MASASTSICISGSAGYDAFINHRGPDVKNTFASHLYHRLVAQGLRVFLDKQGLERGFNFTTQIEAAIRTATMHVAIFSPRYAESKWCLDELLQMLESGAPIIPVFYHVKPAELRGTVLGAQGENGVYSRSLRKLEEKKTYDSETHEEKPRHDPRTIQKWREALSRVSEISGFEVDANNTDEGELLDKVVQGVERVVSKMKLKRHPPERGFQESKFQESKASVHECLVRVWVIVFILVVLAFVSILVTKLIQSMCYLLELRVTGSKLVDRVAHLFHMTYLKCFLFHNCFVLFSLLPRYLCCINNRLDAFRSC